MQFSAFARKFTSPTGIHLLMDDLGKAIEEGQRGGNIQAMLGGGNPAHIPAMNALWRERMQEILATGDEFERMIGNYDTPQGKTEFLDALAELLSQEYGWKLDARNIAVVNGSQTAFFYLFNLLAGRHSDGSQRHVLFPVVPEYIGYADQGIFADDLKGLPAIVEDRGGHRFKYRLDRQALQDYLDALPPGSRELAALCVSRPTNPTGNVLTDAEMDYLARISLERELPLLVDNAYGQPFPGVIYTPARPVWHEQMVLSMSLSKLGLPAARTGILVARPEIITAISSMNAVLSLASGSLGQTLVLPYLKDRRVLELGRQVIMPWYREKSALMLACLDQELQARGIDYSLHESEGAFFAWLWLKRPGLDTREVYRRLKARGVVVVPGGYFFFGLQGQAAAWGREHGAACLRITYARPEAELRTGARIIAEEIAALQATMDGGTL